MSAVALRPMNVVETCAALFGGLSLLVACGGTEPGTSPGAGGAAPGGAGMSSGGAGGSTVTGGSGGAPATGGTGAVAGTPSAGVGGTSAAGGMNGGTTGDTGGDGGMTGGSAGMAGTPSAGGAGMGGAGSGGGSPGGSGGSPALSFRADIFPMFAMTRDPAFVYPGGSTFESCTTTGVCHGGVRPGAGLQMIDADMAYGELFGVASTTELCNGTTRVVAGNPAQSCLILFYEGRLRDELDWVDDAEINLVREWIAGGALP